ncbi:hypothetical protein [Chryseobacterium gossypii]|uniref:hypothetical protein n=1 Tax=Chryseobacterium gossypii TaxID=3231602 RepID=UPI0035267DED
MEDELRPNACILVKYPAPKAKKDIFPEAFPTLFPRFNAAASNIIKIIRNCPRKTLPSTSLLANQHHFCL